MKHTLVTLASCLAFFSILSCKKDSELTLNTPDVPAATLQGQDRIARSNARYVGNGYSESIPIDTANRMIQSYLTGVGYPAVDTALRSLIFDADTLRAYLANPNVVTLKVMLAHRQGYIHSGHEEAGSGLNPEAVTLVVVGLNDNENYVPNSKGEVYDHLLSCPSYCPGFSTATIQ